MKKGKSGGGIMDEGRHELWKEWPYWKYVAFDLLGAEPEGFEKYALEELLVQLRREGYEPNLETLVRERHEYPRSLILHVLCRKLIGSS